MDGGNQSAKHSWMDTTYPIKDMKSKSSQKKVPHKNVHISMCGLPKLGLRDQWLWAIMSSTNATKLHAHEVAQCLWAWTLFCLDHHLPPTLDLRKNLLTFSLSFKRWSWSSSCLSYMSLFEFLFALLMLLFSVNSCVWVSFAHILNRVLVAHILVTLPSSRS